MNISNYIARVATNVLLVDSITNIDIISYAVTNSFSTSQQLTNNYIAPVSNIADTKNLWVLLAKYKRPCCILILLSFN